MNVRAASLTAFLALCLSASAKPRNTPPIFDAVKKGDVSRVKQLLAKGEKPNRQREDGFFLLYLAVDSRNRELTKLLIDKGANLDARSDAYETPSGTALDAAIRNGDREMTELLLSSGAKAANISPYTLNALAAGGDIEFLKLLQEHGADLLGRDAQGNQPIHRAAGNLEMLRHLVDQGADPLATNDIGNQPIQEAVKTGNPETVTFLLTKGANVNAAGFEGDTPLYLARDESMAALLLKNGAKVDQENQRKEQPIHRAAFDGDLPRIRILLAHGATLEAKDAEGQTPLDIAAFSSQRDAMAFFLEKGVKPTDRTLSNALNFGKADNLPLLQQYGAKITANVYLTAYRAQRELFPLLDKEAIAGISGTVLPDAVAAEDMPLVKTLIEAGAVIDAHYPTDHCCIEDGMMGAQAIHYAAACKDPAFMALLLEKGAKADAETIGGLRPIHIAAASGSEAIVSQLLAAGADATAKDPDGKTACELATKKGRKQIIKLLPKPDTAQ